MSTVFIFGARGELGASQARGGEDGVWGEDQGAWGRAGWAESGGGRAPDPAPLAPVGALCLFEFFHLGNRVVLNPEA